MMVEDITAADGQAAYDPAAEKKSGLAGFASSKRGRMLLGGLGAVVLIGIVGAVLFMFVLKPSGDPVEESLVPPAGSVPAGKVTPASSEESATVHRAKPLSSTFVFRDVFEPTTKPSKVPSSTATGTDGTGGTSGTDGTGGTGGTDGTGGTNDGTTDVPPDTLLLQSISTVDGVPVATFVWNGQTYQAKEGEQLGDTPWQVVDISGDSVVMLYGDSRVTLTVGQGISK